MKPLKHWADAVNAILGVWLVVSPWLLGYQDVSAAMWNASIVGVALIAVAMGAIFVPRAWEEWTECGLAAWLVASPWLLGFAAMAFRSAQVAWIHHRRGYSVLERPESEMQDR